MKVKPIEDYQIEKEKLGHLGITQNTAVEIVLKIELLRLHNPGEWNAVILNIETVNSLSDHLEFIVQATELTIIWSNLMAQTIFKLAVATEAESQASM